MEAHIWVMLEAMVLAVVQPVTHLRLSPKVPPGHTAMQKRDVGSEYEPAGQVSTHLVVELSPYVLLSQLVGTTHSPVERAKYPLGHTRTHLKLYMKRGRQLVVHSRENGSAYCAAVQVAVQL